MARYRKVDPRIWNDEKFRSLDDQGKLVFFFLLTHPHMTAIGAMRATVPGLAAEIGWVEKAFREAFTEVLAKGMAEHDEKASFIWLPKFLKYNQPESPNVVKAWSKALELLPECRLLGAVIEGVKDFLKALPEGFRKALPEDFAKSMPYQEQEQEQEQEQNKKPSRAKRELPTDERHNSIRQFIERCCTHAGVPFVWDGSEASALSRWLAGAGKGLAADAICAMVRSRFRSKGEALGDRPRLWIPNLGRWATGPTNQFKQPETVSVEDKLPNVNELRDQQRKAAEAAGG